MNVFILFIHMMTLGYVMSQLVKELHYKCYTRKHIWIKQQCHL